MKLETDFRILGFSLFINHKSLSQSWRLLKLEHSSFTTFNISNLSTLNFLQLYLSVEQYLEWMISFGLVHVSHLEQKIFAHTKSLGTPLVQASWLSNHAIVFLINYQWLITIKDRVSPFLTTRRSILKTKNTSKVRVILVTWVTNKQNER